ncbi:MAG: hypothetical protein KIT88_00990 [Phycisphaeraceae bacterium]|nr:hypothetical protein [Phycisphaeraceae bacterium]
MNAGDLDLNIHVDRGGLNIGTLRAETLVARVGSPIVIYDVDTMVERFYAFAEAFSELRAMVSFDVDAIPNTHVLHHLAKRGAGLSIRSGTDLERAWLSGVPMTRVVYAGLGRSDDDVRAALDGLYSPMFQSGRLVEGRPPYYRGPIGWFSVETGTELRQISRIANGVRIACNAICAVDVGGTGHGSWGISAEHALELFDEFGNESRLRLRGLHMHAGEQARTVDSFVACVERFVRLADQLMKRNHPITLLNLGGGFASNEVDQDAPTPAEYAGAVAALLLPLVEAGAKVVIEPGWSLCAGSCAAISRVLGVRQGVAARRVVCDGVPCVAIARSSAVRPIVAPSDPDATPRDAGQIDGALEHSVRANPGDLIAWPAGGYRARHSGHSACEILLSAGKSRIILPRRGVSDALVPELESQEVIL